MIDLPLRMSGSKTTIIRTGGKDTRILVRCDLLDPDRRAVVDGARLVLEQFGDPVATPVMDYDLLASAHSVEVGVDCLSQRETL